MTGKKIDSLKPADIAAAILREISAIEGYLAAAQDVLASGHMPDMSALETRVADLCKAIENAPEPAQEKCLPEFTALLPRIDACEKILNEWKEEKLKSEGNG